MTVANYTIVKYENNNGKMVPKVVRKNEKDVINVFEKETVQIINDGYKLVSFVADKNNKERLFRKQRKNLILKLLEVN